MELLTMIFILAISYIVLCMKEYGWGVRLFYIVIFFLGLIVMTEGILMTTPDMTYIIIEKATTNAYIMFVIMTLGSIIGMTYKME